MAVICQAAPRKSSDAVEAAAIIIVKVKILPDSRRVERVMFIFQVEGQCLAAWS